jgi:uncharacterized phage-like protein YoqJ
MIIGVTGHRPDKLGGYRPNETQMKVRQAITAKLVELKPEKLVTGMALGVDQWAAEACIFLGIPFIAAVPFEGQHLAWPAESQQRWLDLIAKAAEVVHVCSPGYAVWKMQTRNKWIVDHCDLLLGVWDGTPGGTKNCLDYADKKGRQRVVIDPRQLA